MKIAICRSLLILACVWVLCAVALWWRSSRVSDRFTLTLYSNVTDQRWISLSVCTDGLQVLLCSGMPADLASRSFIRWEEFPPYEVGRFFIVPRTTRSFPGLSWSAWGTAEIGTQGKNISVSHWLNIVLPTLFAGLAVWRLRRSISRARRGFPSSLQTEAVTWPPAVESAPTAGSR